MDIVPMLQTELLLLLWLYIAGCMLQTLECEQEGAVRNHIYSPQNSLPTLMYSSVRDPAVASTGVKAYCCQPSAI